MTTFVHSFSSRHQLCVDHDKYDTVLDLKHALFQNEGIPYDDCFFICNGSLVADDEPVRSNVVYHTYLRLPGGKGGFGSMLRAIGAQIEKTTNHEACRDLSGRRMRDVNNEKDLKDWLGKQAEREQEKEQRRQERIARRRAMPNHKFEDPTYDQQRNLLSQNQEDAITKGLLKKGPKSSATATVTSETMVGEKRKSDTASAGPATKKKKDTEWLGVDMDSLSDLDSDEDGVTAGACAHPGPPTDSDSSLSSEGPNTAPRDWPNPGPSTSQSSLQPGTSGEGTSTTSSDKPGTSHSDGTLNAESGGPRDNAESQCSVESEGKDSQSGSKSAISETEPQKQKCERDEGDDSDKTDKSADKTDNAAKNQEEVPVTLDTATSVTELETLGLDKLKSELMSLGLKCGGTLEQRAERLFSVKGLETHEIDPALFAKSNGKNVKKKK